MSTGFILQSADVPAGVYVAKFSAWEHTTHAEYGAGIKFTWEVTDGPYKGKCVYRTTGAKPTPRNVAGKVLAQLAGTKPADRLCVDPNQFIGRGYTVVVGETDSGFTRVNEILPAKQDAPPF